MAEVTGLAVARIITHESEVDEKTKGLADNIMPWLAAVCVQAGELEEGQQARMLALNIAELLRAWAQAFGVDVHKVENVTRQEKPNAH